MKSSVTLSRLFLLREYILLFFKRTTHRAESGRYQDIVIFTPAFYLRCIYFSPESRYLLLCAMISYLEASMDEHELR